ncbi:MAG: hypothetical protein IK997_05005 [Bacilli bacterium]|nr:hypothetical protein [Bacilli bacterium]
MEIEKKNTGIGIAGFVLSAIAIVFCFIPIINAISYILGVLALVFSIISLVSKKSKKGLPIAAIIITILAFVFASVMNQATGKAIEETSKDLDKLSGESTEEVLKKDVQITLGDLSITTDEYGFNETEMVVTVKNITKNKKSYSFHIEAVDSNGQRINEDYVYVNDLAAGQSTSEKIFTYIEDEKIEAMKNAKFKIVEASVY